MWGWMRRAYILEDNIFIFKGAYVFTSYSLEQVPNTIYGPFSAMNVGITFRAFWRLNNMFVAL